MPLRPCGPGIIIHRALGGLRVSLPSFPHPSGVPWGLGSGSTYLPHILSLSGPDGSGRCSLDHQAGSHRWHRAHRPLGDTGTSEMDIEMAQERVGS